MQLSGEFEVAERVSGVYACAKPVEPPTAEQIARTVAAMIDSPVAVLLMPSCGLPTRGHVTEAPDAIEEHGFPLALRLHAWLASIEQPTRMLVPTYIRRWLDEDMVAAFPMKTFQVDPIGVRTVGVVVVRASSLSRDRFRALELATSELAMRIEDADRIHEANQKPRMFAVR